MHELPLLNDCLVCPLLCCLCCGFRCCGFCCLVCGWGCLWTFLLRSGGCCRSLLFSDVLQSLSVCLGDPWSCHFLGWCFSRASCRVWVLVRRSFWAWCATLWGWILTSPRVLLYLNQINKIVLVPFFFTVLSIQVL